MLQSLLDLQGGLALPIVLSKEGPAKFEGLSIVSRGENFYGDFVRYIAFDSEEYTRRSRNRTLEDLRTWHDLAGGPVFLNEGDKPIEDIILGLNIKDKSTGQTYHENIVLCGIDCGITPGSRRMCLVHAIGINNIPLPQDQPCVGEIWIVGYRLRDGSIIGETHIWKQIQNTK